MGLHPVADYVQNTGKIDILLAFPVTSFHESVYPFTPARLNAPAIPGSNSAAYQLLFKLGESTDEVDPTPMTNMEPVPGDARGGRSGNGIEDMYLDEMVEINLALSKYDQEVYQLMQTMGGLRAAGKIPPTNVGRLMRRDRSFRLLLVSTGDARFIKNYPCCLLKNRRGQTMSSKWSELKLSVSAHHAPLGHWGTQATGNAIASATDLVTYVLENRDIVGLPDPYVSI
jgi:hypothetical protein